MTKRNIRTPEQIILDTQAKLAKLQEKQAMAEAMKNPALRPILDEKAQVQKMYREARKLLGNGPQSAAARIAKHEKWIAKIERELEEAQNWLGVYDQRMSEINTQIQSTIENASTSIEESN